MQHILWAAGKGGPTSGKREIFETLFKVIWALSGQFLQLPIVPTIHQNLASIQSIFCLTIWNKKLKVRKFRQT